MRDRALCAVAVGNAHRFCERRQQRRAEADAAVKALGQAAPG